MCDPCFVRGMWNSSRDQEVHNIQATAGNGSMQTHGTLVAPSLQKDCHHIRQPSLGGIVQRRLSMHILRINVGSSFQQGLDSLTVSPLSNALAFGGMVQRRRFMNILRIHMGSSLKQDLDNLRVTCSGSMVQGIPHLTCVRMQQGLKTILHFLKIAPLACAEQALLDFLIRVRLRVVQDDQLYFRRRGKYEIVIELNTLA